MPKLATTISGVLGTEHDVLWSIHMPLVSSKDLVENLGGEKSGGTTYLSWDPGGRYRGRPGTSHQPAATSPASPRCGTRSSGDDGDSCCCSLCLASHATTSTRLLHRRLHRRN